MVLFIMVRIRAPQPKIKTPLWRFYFWFVATVRDPQPTVAGSKTSRFDKHRAVKSSRFPRSRRDNAVRGNPCATPYHPSRIQTNHFFRHATKQPFPQKSGIFLRDFVPIANFGLDSAWVVWRGARIPSHGALRLFPKMFICKCLARPSF